tara:strand:+ start:538 stop:993 length:456 start_codon:yes stop_codon:yes gene_type:complete
VSTLRVDNLRGQTAGTDRYIVQIVQGTKVGGFSTDSTSFVDITGFSATITPSSVNNKIFILAESDCDNGGSSRQLKMQIVNSGTGSVVGNTFRTTYVEARAMIPYTLSCLDSPNTTSAVTYQVQGLTNTGTVQFGANSSSLSTITLMEIAQ